MKTSKTIFLASTIWWMAGCCACPPPPYADVTDIHPVAIAADVIQWASTDSIWYGVTDTTWDGATQVWAGMGYIDSVAVVDLRLPVINDPTVAENLLGPWPCRWVYGTRIEPAECDEKPIPSYQVVNGRLIIDNTGTVAVCAVYHTKTVKDSVWHCGPDNGVFTK